MAVLVLKIGSVSDDPLAYQDGDIIDAFTTERANSIDIGRQVPLSFLVVKVGELTEEECNDLKICEVDEENNVVKKRKNCVAYKDIPEVSEVLSKVVDMAAEEKMVELKPDFGLAAITASLKVAAVDKKLLEGDV